MVRSPLTFGRRCGRPPFEAKSSGWLFVSFGSWKWFSLQKDVKRTWEKLRQASPHLLGKDEGAGRNSVPNATALYIHVV
ncbi:hypothetical protein ABH20_00360 [Geobacillus sp. T6]|nr:hypothetical protein GT3921_16260 [Geobacillus thermocatenulatus]KLR75391.1 hypothetical protein ABH20_00360 [Geobacillus sp. T6]